MSYPPGMPLDPEQLELLDATDEVQIETVGTDGAVHRTIIWVVVAEGRPFIRSYRGPNARWYREVRRNPNVALLAGDRRIAVRAVPDTDASSIELVSEALKRKYSHDPATPAMVRAEVLPTTLRLEPA